MRIIVLAGSLPSLEAQLAGQAEVIHQPQWRADDVGIADAVIIVADPGPAIAMARRVTADDAAVQVIIAAPPEEHAAVDRAVLFARGVGEVWVRDPARVDGEMLSQAADVTAQRRAARITRRRVEHDLAGIEPHAARRAAISDAYLAALLAVLPDPVISVTDDDEVVSWNRAAELVFGVPRGRAIGRAVQDLVSPLDPAAFEDVLRKAGTDGGRHPDILFEAAGSEPLAADVRVVTVEASGRRVRVLLVHDVTERRRQQQVLEANAIELEQQAEELHHQSVVLEEAESELRRTNGELRTTVAELQEQTRAAERARAEAESANRAKSEFLATMSHEIRTPINAVMGYTDLMQIGLAGPLTDQQREHLERIAASSRHLLRLIDDVLDLARVEAGRITVQHDEGVLVNAVAGAIELVAPQAQAASIRLSSHSADDSDTTYMGDEHRVQQILVNLLANALKFTDEGGCVEVTFGSSQRDDAPSYDSPGGWSWVSVRDTGPGVSEGDRQRIFRPFEQAESGRTRTRGGAGLGLAISLELARLMGGDITLRSEPGHGAEFTLWLPRGEVVRTPAPASPDGDAGAGGVPGLHSIGVALLSSLDDVAQAVIGRMRSEVPSATGLADAQLRDHIPSWTAEIALVLMDLGSAAGPPMQLRDGVEIRRLMAELHGLQRAGLGWSEHDLLREMSVLSDEIVRTARTASQGDASADTAASIIERLIDEATAASRDALRRGVPR
ncbi:MAG TPA: ATP-binding protein [Longimicrobiales bacterium]|nr:ATP-binding protein [Longimicrobiales bacterium]